MLTCCKRHWQCSTDDLACSLSSVTRAIWSESSFLRSCKTRSKSEQAMTQTRRKSTHDLKTYTYFCHDNDSPSNTTPPCSLALVRPILLHCSANPLIQEQCGCSASLTPQFPSWDPDLPVKFHQFDLSISIARLNITTAWITAPSPKQSTWDWIQIPRDIGGDCPDCHPTR